LTPAKWAGSTRTERAASQEHFIDLCRMLEVETPNEADPTGAWYAFEKGSEKQDGSSGFADVWKRGHFAWEYKGKHKNLEKAYQQLLQYRESLENPPLLVVCDLERFEVHTNFTGTKKVVHEFTLEDLRDAPAEPLRVLRALMRGPEELRPNVSREQITEEAASRFADLAERLQKRGHDAHEVALFLNRLLFCLFAEDSALLPERLVSRIIDGAKGHPERAMVLLSELFGKMAREGGGFFGAEEIQWFNGGLFADERVLPLTAEDLKLVRDAAELDWSSIEPAILGTLFERGLDPRKRSQLGAHYTDKESILRVIEPVVLVPLRREFEAMREKVLRLLARGKKATAAAKGADNPNRVFRAFLERLRTVRVLDPSCGSGNFLYLALRALKDLEKEVTLWGAQTLKTSLELPAVGPQVVHGIELNPYAAELARVTVWIGEIQWMNANGYGYLRNPVLRPLQTIECRDALLELSDPVAPRRAEWPDADFIVGNPPFLGGKKMRAELGDDYVEALFHAWDGKVPREADLVTYWHEKARELIAKGRCKRAGLLATQGIRGGANLEVLKKVKQSGDIFMAWSDEPWVVEGAAVRVSIVGQDDGSEQEKALDGEPVAVIHADLSGGARGVSDLTRARRLRENLGVAFMGDTKGGKFDIPKELATEFLSAPRNINGRPNSDVVVPWVNGLDLTRRYRDMYIIDFGVDMPKAEAARYEAPFEHVRREVQPMRATNKRETYRERWWIHVESRPGLRKAIKSLRQFIATPTLAKHRLFVWLKRPTLPDHQLIVIAREDGYAFGVLHSRVHELWALHQGTQLEDRPRYTPTTTFETFPFPWPLNTPDAKLTREQRRHREGIAAAAEALDTARQRWLNPPEWVKKGQPLAPGFPAPMLPKNAEAAKELKKRTLTALYNTPPTWLTEAHAELDRAVFAAYGWPGDLSDDEVLARLLALNLERPAAEGRSREDEDTPDED
jgi:type II restriction/modification system DNA methylase subunit YeeA